MTNPLRDALAAGRFCYVVELVASALTREARLLEAASGLARIPAVVAGSSMSAQNGGPSDWNPSGGNRRHSHGVWSMRTSCGPSPNPTGSSRSSAVEDGEKRSELDEDSEEEKARPEGAPALEDEDARRGQAPLAQLREEERHEEGASHGWE